MRSAVRPVLRRLAAYAIDVALLAAVLIPVAFGLQALVGYRPDTGIGVWLATLLTISLPSWTYFMVADAAFGGVTVGKRLFGLRARALDGGGIPLSHAVVRTAIKLVPWELTHAAMFALAPRLGDFSGLQITLLWLVYALFAAYLAVALRTGGERSLHDLAAGTAVVRS